MNNEGCHQSKFTPGLWTHEWQPIYFTLIVDDFGPTYMGKQHAEDLVSVIDNYYDYMTNRKGKRYLGLTLDWDYAKRKVHLSMPGYLTDALARFKKDRPNKP